MSSELAITAVTATLRQLLQDELATNWDADVLGGPLMKELFVTMLPPNKVRDKHASDNVVNLFLYRTDVNAAWRNHALPTQAKPGESASPPLALNLEYIVTAYGEEDREDAAQYFLAQAMRTLHDRAVVPRIKLRDVLPKARLHEQLEQVTVTPRPLSIEEISKLWSVLQTQYRISATYLVTVVLIDTKAAVKSAPPVLKRGPADGGITALATPPPLLDSARAATGFAAVRAGEELIVNGEHLDSGGLTARLRHPRLADPIDVPVTPIDAKRVKLTIPATGWAAGLWSLSLVVTRPNLPPWTTNEVAFALAPTVTVAPTAINILPGATYELTLNAKPQIRPSQTVIAIVGDAQLPPKSITTDADPNAPTVVKVDVVAAAGLHRVRLRVDGIDSIPVTRVNGVFEFDASQSVQVTTP